MVPHGLNVMVLRDSFFWLQHTVSYIPWNCCLLDHGTYIEHQIPIYETSGVDFLSLNAL